MKLLISLERAGVFYPMTSESAVSIIERYDAMQMRKLARITLDNGAMPSVRRMLADEGTSYDIRLLLEADAQEGGVVSAYKRKYVPADPLILEMMKAAMELAYKDLPKAQRDSSKFFKDALRDFGEQARISDPKVILVGLQTGDEADEYTTFTDAGFFKAEFKRLKTLGTAAARSSVSSKVDDREVPTAIREFLVAADSMDTMLSDAGLEDSDLNQSLSRAITYAQHMLALTTFALQGRYGYGRLT